jgi:hypothetical protein
VQKLPGDAAVASSSRQSSGHRKMLTGNPLTEAQLLSPSPTRLSQTKLSQAGLQITFSQIRETKNRAYGLPREDHYTPESFRMECVGKTCCAAYRVLLPAGNSFPAEFVSGLRMLELAKGFEPPTL